MKRFSLLFFWIGLSVNAFAYHEFRAGLEFADDSLKKIHVDSTYTGKGESSRFWGGLAMGAAVVPYFTIWSMTYDPLPILFISLLVTVVSGIIAFAKRKKLLRTKYKNQPNARSLRLGQWSAGIGFGLWGVLIISLLILLSGWL